MHTDKETREPFLFRFIESEEVVKAKPMHASPGLRGESNPKEEEPPKEPTQKGPYGD